MARLSIIIPVLGNPSKLDDTLVSVLENRPAHCEVVVVHNQPYDDPYHLSDEVCFVPAPRGASLTECLNLGAANAHSPLLHVLMCGVEVCAGWATAALRRFCDPNVVAVAVALVDRENRDILVSKGLGYRAEGTVFRVAEGAELARVAEQEKQPCGPDLLAAFFRRSAVEAVGGFTSWSNPLYAGADLALRLKQAKLRCVWEPESVAHVDSAQVREKLGFARGCDSERFFWRWASENGWVRSLAGHAALLMGECVTTLVHPLRLGQWIGRAWGFATRRRQGSSKSQPADTSPTILPGPHLGETDDPFESRPTARVA